MNNVYKTYSSRLSRGILAIVLANLLVRVFYDVLQENSNMDETCNSDNGLYKLLRVYFSWRKSLIPLIVYHYVQKNCEELFQKTVIYVMLFMLK